MNNLKDIHNCCSVKTASRLVVLSGCQWTIWRIYTTLRWCRVRGVRLFYQDFNEQFEGYTQPCPLVGIIPRSCFIRISMNNLKDIHNCKFVLCSNEMLFYQDFNEQFEGYTQHDEAVHVLRLGCFIRISMNNSAAKVQKMHEIYKFMRKYFVISTKSITFATTNLKDIHNKDYSVV